MTAEKPEKLNCNTAQKILVDLVCVIAFLSEMREALRF
jgi:hypothetical protein